MLSVLCTAATAFAYDFQSGDLYYYIIGENTVEVTYQERWSETNYQGLTTATIPATVTYDGTTYSVTSIGGAAFYECSSLTSITIPNSVTSIEEYTFYRCSALTSITIPNSVTSIGQSAFYYCSSLTSITIPNSVTSIGWYVFTDCDSLTSIVVESGNTVYDSRNNCNAIIATATNTLIVGCQSTTIPYSVTSIEAYAFYDCSSLTSITIPNSVISIGHNAFSGCSALTSITCLATTPPTCGDDCFYGVLRTIPLYVPDEAVEDYKAAAVWQEFNIVAESDAPTAIETTKSTDTKGGQKILRNGQVLIIRNGETYDMMGQML